MIIKMRDWGIIIPVVVIGLFALLMAATPMVDNSVSTVNQVEDPHNDFINRYSEEGIASWYGYESCTNLKCLMANGQPLDITKDTVAFWKAPLGSMVKVTNIANNKSVIAEVTDTGGFNKLGRLIDLNEGVKNKLECSDLCRVIVYY